jgi:hypothetical protein
VDGAPLIASADAARAGDDVGNLAGQTRQVQCGAVDDFDSLDVVRVYPLQLVEDVLGLARQPLAIDQHVGAGLAKPSALVLIIRALD